MKDKLKKFFDKYFKNQHPEAALRYIPIIKVIKKHHLEDSKILEIGSGSLGITPYLKKPIDGIDVDFSGPQSDLLNKISGSALDLPFRKNSYDVVLSADTLEHIPQSSRPKALEEHLRVAKKLALILVPVGELSQNQDKALDKYYWKIHKTKYPFLEEHVQNGLPQTDEILVTLDKILRKMGKEAKITSKPVLNLHVRLLLMRTWISNNKYIYYLYLKGFLLLVPLLKFANFSNCYRRLFVIEFVS